MDSGNLANLTSSQPYDKQSYFQQYQKSFKDGEYNLHEPVYTPMGQSIRRYMSGGITMPINKVVLPIPANESFFQRLKQPLSTFLMAITVTGSLLVSSAGAEGPAVKIVNPSENYFVNKQAEPNLEDLSQSKILPIKLYANQAVALANRKDLEKTLIFGLNKALYSRIDKAEMLAKLMGLLNNDIERLRIIKQVHSNRHSNDINPEIMRHWKQVLDNLKKKLPDDRGINLINLGEVGNEVMRDDIEKEMDWFKDVESVYEMDRLFESNNAVEKLFDLGEKIFPDLKRKARSGSEIAVETLKRHGAKAVEYILNTTPKDRRDEGYYFGIQLLKKIGEAGIGALETAMNAGIKNERGSIDVERQTLAAVALAGIGKPETIDEILKVWHTVDSVPYTERLQVALIKALGNIPAPKEKNKEIISELVNVYVGYGWDELAVATTTSLAQLYMREDSLELKMQIVDRLIGKLRSSFSRKHSLWKSITDARIDYDSLLWKLRDFNYISSADGISPEFKGLGDAFIEKYSKIYTEDNIRQINAALLQSATNDNIRVVLENLNIKNESIRRYIVGLALRYNEINIFDRSVFDLIKILSVYKNDDFATKTGNMDIVTQFSIARTVVETLSQLSAPINDVSINKALSFIIQTREQHAGRIIVDKDTNFIYLGHVGLSSENMPGLFKQKFNMNLRSFNIDNRYSQYSDPEGFVPTMDHFMDAVVYGPRKTTIYFSGHGLPDKLLLSNTIDPEGGSPWEHVIQYENFAGMLLRRAKNQGGSLSDLTIILDSCYSADFANKVLNNLSEDLQNGKIKTLPVIVTTSANGAASKVYVASDAIKSVFLRAEETEAFTINEIFKAMTEAGTRGEEFSLFLPMSSEEFMLFKQSLGVETNKKPDEKSDKRLNIVLPIIQARVYLKNYPPTHQHNKEESFVSSAIIDNNKGGIDLSRINKSIRTESVSSPGVGGLNNLVDADFDLNEELTQLRKLLNAEIVPSADRLNRYARAACPSSLSSPDTKDSALSLIAETFRLQENKAAPAAAELKALAAWLEQGW